MRVWLQRDVEVRFLVKKPVPPLIEGVAFRADCPLAWIKTGGIRIIGVEFSEVAARVDVPSASYFG
jgi:hypothetical protein